MRPIEGSAPDPVAVPEGCSYHPRCPLADEQCRQQDPAFRPTENDPDSEFDWNDSAGPGGLPTPGAHEAACHHWEQAEEAIPFVGEEVFEE